MIASPIPRPPRPAARAAVLVLTVLLLPAATGAQEREWSIDALSREIAALTERVAPAVVQIYTSSYGQLTPSGPQGAAVYGRQQATGSGVILAPDGFIVTNRHVVEGAKRVQVRLAPAALGHGTGTSIVRTGDTLVGAQVLGVDRETDLAVLKIARKDLPYLELGDSEALHQGQLVFAFGSPLGLNNSVSFGVVSTVARQLERDSPMIYIQTDVAINPGNSGGPLVNARGEVVGINTLIFSQSGGSEGLSFSAPSNIVRTIYEQIRSGGRVRRGVVGVHAQTLNPWIAEALGLPVQWGVILGDVYPGGPAAAAGLRPGDVVLELDGKPMENARQFEVNVYGKPVGRKVTLQVMREGRTFAKQVDVIERRDPDLRFLEMISPDRNLVPRLGVLCLDLDKDVRALLPFEPRSPQGVLVAAMAADLAPFGESFAAGDIIAGLNGRPVTDLRGLRAAVGELAYGQPAVFQVERGGRLRYVVVSVE